MNSTKEPVNVKAFHEGCVKSWRRHDTLWLVSLFGTAVGAGILFLPMDVGQQGVWPVILIGLFIGPVVFYAHRALAYFVLSSKNPEADITDVAEEHFGPKLGFALTLVYFVAIYAILLIYGVGATNTVNSFIVHQLGMTPPPRTILAFVINATLIGVIVSGEHIMLRATELLVYPLIVILTGLSLALIPHWHWEFFSDVPSFGDFISTIWIALPVLVFSFTYAAATSYFAQAQREYYQEHAHRKVSSIMCRANTVLLVFVMFFVISCVLALTPEQLHEAKHENITVLSYLSTHFENPLLNYVGPVVAITAIMSSYFGHYLGAREGIIHIGNKCLVKLGRPERKGRKMEILAGVFFLVTISIVSVINPSILKIIEGFSGPIIACILFLMPMYAIRRIDALARFRGQKTNYLVTFFGILTVSSVIYQLHLI